MMSSSTGAAVAPVPEPGTVALLRRPFGVRRFIAAFAVACGRIGLQPVFVTECGVVTALLPNREDQEMGTLIFADYRYEFGLVSISED